MKIVPTAVHCLNCNHEWIAETIQDAPVAIWAASVEALRCPKCAVGAKKIAFGRRGVPDPQPIRSGLTDSEKRAEWLKLHDNGLSSECIAEVMCGLLSDGSYPHDGDDFGRCERLLILYPEWRSRFGEMAAVNVVWAALVPRWSDIEAAWRHDLALPPKRKRPISDYLCYPLMRSIVDPVIGRGS